LETQAEGALFGEQDAAASIPARVENEYQQPSSSSDAEKAFDDYLANIDSFASPAPTAEPSTPVQPAATQATAAPEPYSEQAWSHESFTSDLEPQAEGALFGEQDASASIPARVENEYQQPSSSSDAEKAFDDYLANIASFTTPAPVSAPAVETSNPPAPAQPEADAYVQKASSMDAEQAFDDYFGKTTATAPEANAAQTSAASSEWSYAPTFEDGKPQADTAAYDTAQEPEEEEEPAPAPRKYNEYGEIREWEPEPEPEADLDDVPTVSRYMGQSDQSDDISLDDLLDEIIKAGD
ncbi:MAG: hypothetical protein PHW41_10040, partial [Eubacteriales bacterium]|nr:hypothetical protein [Eubacteriales bacterium]